jgi:hypothetical protein
MLPEGAWAGGTCCMHESNIGNLNGSFYGEVQS